MSKTVFVFGAGFSAPAKMPVQADIMREVVHRHSQTFQEIVRQTYTTLFQMPDAEAMENVPLEDVFTMLDRARRSRETIRGLNHIQIEDSYGAMIKAITHEFNKHLIEFDEKVYFDFFKELIDRRIGNGDEFAQKLDLFSIITLNWDTIADYLIHKIGGPLNAGLDYTCYDYDLNDTQAHIPSIMLKAKGKFNIKLIKLHGSLNWLVCSGCGRLFSTKNMWDRPPVAFMHDKKCKFCQDIELENLIITPTLVKDLTQTHLKMVWHNALMDLQEAERIVFVGYSFPLADFEFRYILLKAITGRRDVLIRVLLYPPDTLCKSPEQKWVRKQVEERYINFFGYRDIDFKYMDVADFMKSSSIIWNW